MSENRFTPDPNYSRTIIVPDLARPPKFSLNGRFILEPYMSDREIKATTTGGGFAMIQQKVAVKGLKLLMNASIDGTNASMAVDGVSQSGPLIIPAGSMVFIREEYLFTQPWAKHVLEAEGVGKFIIVEKQFVEFIQPV